MNKWLLIFLGLFSGVWAMQGPTPDTVVLAMRNDKVIIISEFKTWKERRAEWIARKKKRPAKYIGLGMGASALLSTKDGILLKGNDNFLNLDYSKSVHVQLNILAYRFRLTNDLGITTGFGFNFDHFVFAEENKDFLFTNTGVTAVPIAAEVPETKYKKYSLNTADIHIPLLLEFAPIKTKFRIASGFTFGYLFDRRLLRKMEVPGQGTVKSVRTDNIDINPFQIMSSTEIGYSFLTFYFDYNLLRTFKGKDFQHLHIFHLGVRLVL